MPQARDRKPFELFGETKRKNTQCPFADYFNLCTDTVQPMLMCFALKMCLRLSSSSCLDNTHQMDHVVSIIFSCIGSVLNCQTINDHTSKERIRCAKIHP